VLINFLIVSTFSVSHAALSTSVGISDVGFGYLSSACLDLRAQSDTHRVLLDKYGVKRIGRISTLLWSVATFSACDCHRGARWIICCALSTRNR